MAACLLMGVPLHPLPAPADEPAPETRTDIQWLTESRTGDLDEMVKRGLIRALVVPSETDFFLDGATARGISMDTITALQAFLNDELPGDIQLPHVKPVPVTRDELLTALVEGRGDIAIANLTITPERLARVDFSKPIWSDVKEVVVTGPTAPKTASLDDLSGLEVFVRRSSSYRESLLSLNRQLQAKGLASVVIAVLDERLVAEDILDLLHAGVLGITVVDDIKARFWAQVFDDITVHEDLVLRSGGQIGIALRKESPRLKEVLDTFAEAHGKGTLVGNVVFQRYLKEQEWIDNATAEEELDKLGDVVDLIKVYAGRYGFDWLMIAAQAYQESGLDQSRVSPRGAIGVMQVLPSTAADPAVAISGIEDLESNIHAGVKYLALLRDRFLDDTAIGPVDRVLLSFAAYNAGPGNLAKMRQRATKMGLDPDVWFGNVELAAARLIGRETVQYVSNIYKYYVAYSLILEATQGRASMRDELLK